MTGILDLIEISQLVSRGGVAWTQGAGGNISVKISPAEMIIKASGLRLDAVKGNENLVKVSVDKLRGDIASSSNEGAEENYVRALRDCADATFSAGFPSMETAFHVALSAKWVLHFHPLAALLMAETLRKGTDEVAIVDFVKPGLDLAAAIDRVKDRKIILLRQHGVVLQDDERPDRPGGILDRWRKLEREFLEREKFPKLLSLIGNPASAKGVGLSPTPRRIYFPDAAVFAARVSGVTNSVGKDLFQLKADAFSTDRDAAEIWLATQLLYHSVPNFPELPGNAGAEIRALPLEKRRAAK